MGIGDVCRCESPVSLANGARNRGFSSNQTLLVSREVDESTVTHRRFAFLPRWCFAENRSRSI
jgi:hypothetical protein